MLKYQITSSPATEPVTLADMKLHLRVDDDTDDDLITSLISAARQWCEDYENRAYITQTITLKRDDLENVMVLPRPKLQSVTSIKYIDLNGVQQTVDSTIYNVDIHSEPGRVTLAYNQNWPNYRGDVNGIEIIYVSGYGAASAVPAKTIAAIKLLTAHLYENRQVAVTTELKEIPLGVKSLLNEKMKTI